MRLVAISIVMVALFAACKDKGKENSAEGSAVASGTGPGTASVATPTPPPTTTTTPAAAPTCAAACEHRKSCGIAGDVAACNKDCEGLAELLAANAPKELGAYVASDCDVVKQNEVGFVQAGACIRGCKRALECGVVGTYPACFVECATNLEKQAYTVADLDKVTASDCETIKKTVVLTPPRPAPTANWREAEAEALFRRNPRFPMCNDHNDCGGSAPVCCRQMFHRSCVTACM